MTAIIGRKDWASKVDPKHVITARRLEVGDGSGWTLVDVATAGQASPGGAAASDDAALGSGYFGKVDKYQYFGASVAVKEVKAGVDDESIGKPT